MILVKDAVGPDRTIHQSSDDDRDGGDKPCLASASGSGGGGGGLGSEGCTRWTSVGLGRGSSVFGASILVSPAVGVHVTELSVADVVPAWPSARAQTRPVPFQQRQCTPVVGPCMTRTTGGDRRWVARGSLGVHLPGRRLTW